MKRITKLFAYASIGLIPFYFLRFKFLIPTNIFEIFVLISLVLTLCSEKMLWSDCKKWILPILFIFVTFVAALISDDKTKALGILKGWFIIPVLFSWVVSQNFSKKDLPKLSIPIYSSSLLISIWAILQKVGLVTTLFYQKGDSSFDQYVKQGRVFGPFESPNYLAMFLIPMVFLSIPIIQLISKKSYKIIASISLILPLTAVVLSQSRAGLVSLAAAIVAVVIFNGKKLIKNKAILTVSIVLILILSSLFVVLNSDRLGGDNIRREIYHYSYDLLKPNWLIGIGLGDFQTRIDSISKDNWSFQTWGVPFALHPHNLFLAMWLNLGLLGILIFLIINIQIFVRLLRSHNIQASFALAALTAVLVHGMFDTTYFKNDLSAIFWLIFAYSLILSHENEKEKV